MRVNLDSRPNAKASGLWLSRENDKVSTESGTAIKPANRGGRLSNSRRCDGDPNISLEIEAHAAKQSRPTN
jgi:hypothetical protein